MKTSILILMLLFVSSCSEVNQEKPPGQSERVGAVYIGCELPSWQFDFDDLFLCEQAEPVTEEINPENACPMSDIQIEVGEIEVLFSDNTSLGRILVRVNDDVFMEDENGAQVSEIYINDNDEWFLSKYDIRLKLTMINVYVGNCYHELIKWEESPIIL